MTKEITDARKEMLERFAGPCVREQLEGIFSTEGDAQFTYEDIAAFQDAYFGGEGERYVHMSDLPGRLCFRSMGEGENRKLADRIQKTCKKNVLTGSDGKGKCDAFHAAVEERAGEPGFWSMNTVKWAGKWLIGGTAVGATFHAGGKMLEASLRSARVFWAARSAVQVAATEVAVAGGGGAAVGGTAVAAEIGAVALPVVCVVGAFAGGLVAGHALDKGAAKMLGIKSADGDSSLSGWYADEAANLTPRSAQMMIHDIAAWF